MKNKFEIKKTKGGLYSVIKNGSRWAEFKLEVQEEKKKERRFTYLSFKPEDKRIERSLSKLILKEFLKFDKKSNFLALPSKNGVNDKLAEHIGAETGSDQIMMELKTENVNNEFIDKWSRHTGKFKKFKTVLFKKLPEKELDHYCRIFSSLLKDMPENSELFDTKVVPSQIKHWQKLDQKTGDVTYVYNIYDEKDKIIAMTNVAVSGKDRSSAHQFMTGVVKKHRGKGFAKALKALMFKALTEDFPELKVIRTETHPLNHGSKMISLKIGYEITGRKKEYKISRQKAQDYIKKN